MNSPVYAIEAAELTRQYPSRRGRATLKAVDRVSLRVAMGRTTALVGESGSGKSTLARLLLGLAMPSSGDAYIHGEPVNKLSRKARARLVQPVFQDPYASLNPTKRVGDIVALPLKALGQHGKAEIQKRVNDVLAQVGLGADFAMRYPAELSGGQRQRVAIARALITDPKVLICDEPTSALDVSVQAQILNLLLDLRANRTTSYLVVTHNINAVSYIADRIAVMYRGRIVEEGEMAQVLRAPGHPYTALLLSAVLPLDPQAELPDLDAAAGTSTAAPDTGCTFAPRCRFATDLCRKEEPIGAPVAGRFVLCHFPLNGAAQTQGAHIGANGAIAATTNSHTKPTVPPPMALQGSL
ncbi:oligopeptide/dipeptide ABC transporter ATP-binding protein [Paraburkholderia sp.]|uniref:oligopeptide/dipeptide ABC transporter ATP-binding protein n=1 Tax=Paraburkholderia sp. TaxID=1926495 RepID=UPI0039E66234